MIQSAEPKPQVYLLIGNPPFESNSIEGSSELTALESTGTIQRTSETVDLVQPREESATVSAFRAAKEVVVAQIPSEPDLKEPNQMVDQLKQPASQCEPKEASSEADSQATMAMGKYPARVRQPYASLYYYG